MRLNEDVVFDHVKTMSDYLMSLRLINIGNVDQISGYTTAARDSDLPASVKNFHRIAEGLSIQYAVWLDTLLSRNFHSSSLSLDLFREAYSCSKHIDFITFLQVMDSIYTWLTNVDEYESIDDMMQYGVLKRYIDRRWDAHPSYFGISVLITPFLERLLDNRFEPDPVACWFELLQASCFIKRLPLEVPSIADEALTSWIERDLDLSEVKPTVMEEEIISEWFPTAFPLTCIVGIIPDTGTVLSLNPLSVHCLRNGDT